MTYLQKITTLAQDGKLPVAVAEIMRQLYLSYMEAVRSNHLSVQDAESTLERLSDCVILQIANPYHFEPLHQRINHPIDYYQLGIDFLRPLVNMEQSKVYGLDVLDDVETKLKKGENVVFLANHQIEADPQAISILLENTHQHLAENMIFVAGHRVISDPLAVPFSLGRNLICIYSKKHVNHPPEQKAEKVMHNQKAIQKMLAALSEGGKCIYVAPSGGRDRPDAHGKIHPAKFDPQSIDLFFLIAKKAERPTHFYPLTLSTYSLLPPPDKVEKEIGEIRRANVAPVYLHFGKEVDLDAIVHDVEGKKEKSKKRADLLWQIVNNHYKSLGNL